MNAASFGKLIRSVFLGLRTRRYVRDHWPTYLDVWPGTTCSLAWLGAVSNTLGGGKPVIESKHQLWPRPGRSSFISRELKAEGIAYVYVWLERFYDLPEGHAYTFVICILSTSLTSVSIFYVCCYSRSLSRWLELWKVTGILTVCTDDKHYDFDGDHWWKKRRKCDNWTTGWG